MTTSDAARFRRTAKAEANERVETYEWSEHDCQCWHGAPRQAGLSGHEFSPFNANGVADYAICRSPGVWRGLWQCGGCPDTHTTLVCDECRGFHDADAASGVGVVMMWMKADD